MEKNPLSELECCQYLRVFWMCSTQPFLFGRALTLVFKGRRTRPSHSRVNATLRGTLPVSKTFWRYLLPSTETRLRIMEVAERAQKVTKVRAKVPKARRSFRNSFRRLVAARVCTTTTNNNDQQQQQKYTIWGGSVLTGEEPPPHSGELKHALTLAGGPTQSQRSRLTSSGHHISMEHRLRRRRLNSDTDASNKTYLKEIQEKRKEETFLFRKNEKRK